eukprot:Colp12_sorted_trinity150504_noHs@29523
MAAAASSLTAADLDTLPMPNKREHVKAPKKQSEERDEVGLENKQSTSPRETETFDELVKKAYESTKQERTALHEGLLTEQTVIENDLRRAMKRNHGQMEEALILQTNLLESQQLRDAQLMEKNKVLDRQRLEANERLARDNMHTMHESVLKQNKAWQQRIHQLEQAMDKVQGTRLRIKQSREGYQLRMQLMQERQIKERKELTESQSRTAGNLVKMQNIEMSHLTEEEQAIIKRDFNLLSQQLVIVQRKEAEQLRETQLFELNFMNQEFEHELKFVEKREQMKADHIQETYALKNKQKSSVQQEKERLAVQESEVIAMNLRELQDVIADQLDVELIKVSKDLEREQKERAQARVAQRKQEDHEEKQEFLASLGSAGHGRGNSEKGSSAGRSAVSTGERARQARQAQADQEATVARQIENEHRKEQITTQHRTLAGERRQRDEATLDSMGTLHDRQLEALVVFQAQEVERANAEYQRDGQRLKQHYEEGLKALKKEHAEEMMQLLHAQEREQRMVREAEQVQQQLTAAISHHRDEARKVLESVVPHEHAQSMLKGQAMEATAYPLVTVMVANLVNFDQMAATNPEKTYNVLGFFHEKIAAIAEQESLQVVLQKRDTVVLAAGMPNTATTHASSCLNAALAAVQAMNEYPSNPPLALRVGLHTGPATNGIVGVKPPQYLFYGEAVSVATALAKSGQANQVCATEKTNSHTQPHFHGMHGQPISVEGTRYETRIITGAPTVAAPPSEAHSSQKAQQ